MSSGHGVQIVAIGGGKGGVGKTFVSTNVAIGLAARGSRVLLVDADFGGANAHTLLGMAPPARGLSDVLVRKSVLDDVAVPTPFPNLKLVAGASDDLDAGTPKHAARQRLLRQFTTTNSDWIVLDLGAGTAFHTLDLFLAAGLGILVVQPEPSSVENAYRFIKAAFFRRLAVVEKAFSLDDVFAAARQQRNDLNIHTPADLMRAIGDVDAEAGKRVRDEMDRFVPGLVLNQVRTSRPEDAAVAGDMASACRRFLGVRLDVLGSIPDDVAAREAAWSRTPLRVMSPDGPATRALDHVVGAVLMASASARGRAA